MTALKNGKTKGDELSRNGRSDLDGRAGRVAGAVQVHGRTDKGVHSFPVTLKTSGSQKVIATDQVSSARTGSQTVTVRAGPAKTFGLSSLAGVTAGTPQSITLTVRDAFNDVATGYRGTVQLRPQIRRPSCPRTTPSPLPTPGHTRSASR